MEERTLMGFLQAVLGGLFTILGAGSMFFIAYKALTIGNDVSEMKDMLRDMQRAAKGLGPTPASFPTPLDAYDAPLSSKPDKEFVLPEPISRRLDAERGIRQDSPDDLEYGGLKASERRH